MFVTAGTVAMTKEADAASWIWLIGPEMDRGRKLTTEAEDGPLVANDAVISVVENSRRG